MCSVLPCTVLRPLWELYSVTANFSEAKESYASKHRFITTEYVLLVFKYLESVWRQGGQGLLWMVGGVKRLCKSVNLAGYRRASFSWQFFSMLSQGNICAIAIAAPQIKKVSCVCGISCDGCSLLVCWVHSWQGAGVPLLLIYRQINDIKGILTVTVNVGVQTFTEFGHQAFQTHFRFRWSCYVGHCTCLFSQWQWIKTQIHLQWKKCLLQ